MIPPILLAALQLAQSIVALIPEPDPAVRALRARHRADRLSLHYAHRAEIAAAKRERK